MTALEVSRSVTAVAEKSAAATLRLPLVDLLRAVASHIIAWHHLMLYGPLSDAAYAVVPQLVDPLLVYGRMAVQVFFTVGGFMTARGLSRHGPWTSRDVGRQIIRRYRRIGFPYLGALAAAIVANDVARRCFSDSCLSASPTLAQLLAHALFLQDILGYEALSAGVWYLAIDFQLGLLVMFAVVLCRLTDRVVRNGEPERAIGLLQCLLWPLAVASLFWFNRNERLDVYAIYFFGSFFTGMAAEWTLTGRMPRWGFWLYAALLAGALVVDWRPRLVVSLATGLVLYLGGRARILDRWPDWKWPAYWGKRSYSLFLIHFPVLLLVNALLAEVVGSRPIVAIPGLLLAYGGSLLAAVAFYRLVEAPAAR